MLKLKPFIKEFQRGGQIDPSNYAIGNEVDSNGRYRVRNRLRELGIPEDIISVLVLRYKCGPKTNKTKENKEMRRAMAVNKVLKPNKYYELNREFIRLSKINLS